MKALEVVQNYRGIDRSSCMWDGHFVIAEKVQFWQGKSADSSSHYICHPSHDCNQCKQLLDKDVVCIEKYLPQNGVSPYRKE